MISDHDLTVMLRLVCQGLTRKAIARWMNGITGDIWNEKKVENLCYQYARHLPPGGFLHGDPGTGDFETCRFCGVWARMPCVECAIKAMRKS